ncbi:MAG: DUF1697 domain-containing protein [Hyphomicrobiales bacterium]
MSHTYIALLRAINVGGNNILKMADLKLICADLGFENTRTYIQSGNVAFESDSTDKASLGQKLSDAIEVSHGFAPPIFMLEKNELTAALDAQILTFDDEKFLSFYFLERPALDVDFDKIDELKLEDDAYNLTDKVFYLHCPAGVGRSKLAAKVDRLLGVQTTARNLRSVKKIIELAG